MVALAILYLGVALLWWYFMRLLQRFFKSITDLKLARNKILADLNRRLEDQQIRQQRRTELNYEINAMVSDRLSEIEQKLTFRKDESASNPKVETLTTALKHVLESNLALLKTKIE